MKIRASVSLTGFSLIAPSCTTTFVRVNTKFEIVRDAWTEFAKYKVLIKELLETWSDVIKRVGLLSDLLVSNIAIFARIASACKISVSSELRTDCLFQTDHSFTFSKPPQDALHFSWLIAHQPKSRERSCIWQKKWCVKFLKRTCTDVSSFSGAEINKYLCWIYWDWRPKWDKINNQCNLQMTSKWPFLKQNSVYWHAISARPKRKKIMCWESNSTSLVWEHTLGASKCVNTSLPCIITNVSLNLTPMTHN